ncbi:MAG: SDR family oxidoreductase [Thermoplasmata archaeon]|jgi:NAD(P)-dependent dehydrogenase (short-subunit alcohol dehydrogenase family)|nr:SDR family oxidoreductase [Thermoplasmata archaeon]
MRPDAHPVSVALITGASRGLGRTLAQFLSAEGYELILTARGRADLDETTRSLRTGGPRIEAVGGDVTDPDHRTLLARLVQDRGRLDLLINNASDLGPTPLPELARYPLPELRRVLEVNLLAPIALVQALLPWLEAAQGRVLNISSDAALGGYPGWGGYGASKAALDLVSRTLAEELKDRHVGVISVDPGDMRTAMHQAAFPGQDISDRPLPEATVPFWAWLLHQDAPSITGRRFRAQSDRWEIPA